MNFENDEKRLNMYGYFVKCIFNYFDFKGRASRREYWSFMLFYTLLYLWFLFILNTMVKVLDPCKYPPENFATLSAFIVIAPFVIPCIAVSVRRMHDLNKTGWYVTLPFFCISLELFMLLPKGFFMDYFWLIAIFNSIVYFCYTLFFFMKRGNRGRNKYGENPMGKLEMRNEKLENNHTEDNDVKKK